jgi:NAD(P)H-hydrate epimerase
MIKILPVEKIREADAYTIKNEPIPSIDLMERAATACFEWLRPFLKKESHVKIVCGPGNNGGDGLALARMLTDDGILTSVWILNFTDKKSRDFNVNRDRLKVYENIEVLELSNSKNIPEINEKDVIVDAIFGSGLTRLVEGFVADVINAINENEAVCISIDIPSGLFADSSTPGNAIVKADYTLSFELPKLAFLFAENNKYVGDWHILPIGLHESFIEDACVNDYLITASTCFELIEPRSKFSHKGNYGHALLIAGSNARMGAAILSSKACLRSGIGLLTTHIPFKGNCILQTSVPEAMLSLDRFENYLSDIPDLSPYNVIGVGPGIGTQEQSQNALKVLIQSAKIPIVFDADALNILAENKTWFGFLPPNCILTPHLKEFERLTGKANNDFERIKLLREFATKYQVYIVLKGAHTVICTPKGKCFYNTTGNPGMATAGSGDVLTGVILALLGQSYSSVESCILGVFIHGLAGDLALKKRGHEALISSDIIDYLGKAFKKIY